jgi:hypothetical protein
MVWSKADSFAVKFVDSVMLNDPRFHYLGLCDDNWKLKYWISKNYPSWVRNHLISDTSHTTVKAKEEALDNDSLLKISPEPSEPDQYPNSHGKSSDSDMLDSEDVVVSSLISLPEESPCLLTSESFQTENLPSARQIIIVDPLQ